MPVRESAARTRERIRRRRTVNTVYRVGVAVLGVGIIALGVVLLPLPGPGWLVIFAGLFVLATEFVWAERLQAYARRRVGEWTDWVQRQSLAVRVLLGLATLAVVAAALWGYVAWKGVPGWIPFVD